MAKNTSIWLAGLSSIALISGAALAQTTPGQKMDEAAAHSDAAAEQAGRALNDAAAATGQAAENAGDAVVDTASDAATATGNAVENAATATGNAVDNAATATGNAVDNAAEATADMADRATTDMAEGTPVEGQIFQQDENTFLASTLMDASIINATGDSIGDVDDLVVTAEGQITGVVVGVGGFLGVGEKLVALEMSRLNIQFDDDGDLVFSVNETEEALENAPAFVTSEEQERERERAAATAATPATPVPAAQ